MKEAPSTAGITMKSAAVAKTGKVTFMLTATVETAAGGNYEVTKLTGPMQPSKTTWLL
jgi:hypothetical protein